MKTEGLRTRAVWDTCGQVRGLTQRAPGFFGSALHISRLREIGQFKPGCLFARKNSTHHCFLLYYPYIRSGNYGTTSNNYFWASTVASNSQIARRLFFSPQWLNVSTDNRGSGFSVPRDSLNSTSVAYIRSGLYSNDKPSGTNANGNFWTAMTNNNNADVVRRLYFASGQYNINTGNRGHGLSDRCGDSLASTSVAYIRSGMYTKDAKTIQASEGIYTLSRASRYSPNPISIYHYGSTLNLSYTGYKGAGHAVR